MEFLTMFIQSLKLIALGLMGAIALNAITPTLTPAKDTPKAATPTAPAAKKAASSIWEQLNLTKEQKGKLQAIRTKRTLTISKVLNKDQKAIFDKLRGKKKVMDMFTELKLDANQQKLVKAALQQANKDIILVLTPDQQKQLSARKESAE
jgi:Spy/CpxP family protein refolding chaperone